MLVAAAICPHPPLLVPEAMGSAGWPDTPSAPAASARRRAGSGERADAVSPPGEADEVDGQLRLMRAACYAAVSDLAAVRPDLIAVVGGGRATRSHPWSAAGTLRGFGVPFSVGAGEAVLPLSLTIGKWLVRRCLPGHPWDLELREVATSEPARRCLDLGAGLARQAARVGLLVLGDGSARRSLGVPGADDLPATGFDDTVASALAAADGAALAGLDQALADEVCASGRAAWQVLAGAAAGAGMRGRLRYAGAPLGVGYLVANWTT